MLRDNRGMRSGAVLVAFVAVASAFAIDFNPQEPEIAVVWPSPARHTMAVINSENGSLRYLASALENGRVAFSPNGRYIAYESITGAMLHDNQTGRVRALPGEGARGPFAWRPDSAQLAFFRVSGNSGLLEGTTVNASDLREFESVRLRNNRVTQAQWLPQTDTLAVLAGGDIVLLERGTLFPVTTTGDVVGMGLGADGRRLYWARRGKNMRFILMTLFEYDLHLRSVRRLPFPDRLAPMNPTSAEGPSDLEVVFGPGCNRMVLLGKFGAGTRIVRVDRTGNDARELGRIAAGVAQAAFSHDGLTVGLFTDTPSPAQVRLLTFRGTEAARKVLRTWTGPHADEETRQAAVALN